MLDLADLGVELAIAVAGAVLVLPFVFVVLIGIAVRSRGPAGVDPRLAAAVTLVGGLSLGSMLLVTSDITVEGPIVAVIVALVAWLLRRRRRAQAGWLLAGAAVPWTLAWAAVALGAAGTAPARDGAMLWLLAGTLPLAAGLGLALRGDPPRPAPDIAAPAGQPGSRSFGSIAEAIREAARVGPFGVPEIALLVAVVATLLVVPFLLPAEWPSLARSAIVAIAMSVVATEAYVRVWPDASRRAFEAFSWLGEWELAQARALTGRGVPTSPATAEAWLASRPERPEEAGLRIEIALFANRLDEARKLLERLPQDTPWDRFSAAALRDLVDWRAGGPGNLQAMREAAAAIQPPDGDERLRAEVSIATAMVRRRMAEALGAPAEIIEPLVAVRARLGRRADGQIGRALRRRLLPLLAVGSLAVAVASELLFGRGALP